MEQIEKDFAEIQTELHKYSIYLNIHDLRGLWRDSELNFQRAIVVHFLRKKEHTLQEIGKFLNRGHANVINALKYKNKKHGRDLRYDTIISNVGSKILSKGIIEKIKYHEVQINELKKELLSYSEYSNLLK